MERHRLTDEQWECIADVFPPPAKTGHPPPDRRQMMDGILHILRTGAPWRDLPRAFGPCKTVWYWFNRWTSDGTLDKVLACLQADCVDADEIDRELWCVDGTTVRAARCAAGGGKKTTRASRKIMR